MRLFFIFVLCFTFSTTFTAIADGDGTKMAQNVVNNILGLGVSADIPKVTAVLEAERMATLSAGIRGKITEIPFNQGENFKKGDLLVAFNCAVEKARYARAEAKYQSEKVNYEAHRKLAELRSVASVELAITKADMTQAQASMIEQEAILSECQIRAPFDGAVTEKAVNIFEMVEEGTALLRIISTDKLEVRMLVPSEWLVWIKKGQKIILEVNETGQNHDAIISRINAAIDPVSRLVEVTATIKNKAPSLKSGMTGVAYFPKEEIPIMPEPENKEPRNKEGSNQYEEVRIKHGELRINLSSSFGFILEKQAPPFGMILPENDYQNTGFYGLTGL